MGNMRLQMGINDETYKGNKKVISFIMAYLFLFNAYGTAHNVREFPRAPNKLAMIPQMLANLWKVGEIISVNGKRRFF